MERLDVCNCSNILIASYFTDEKECAHENREHTLIYLCSGKLEIREEQGRKTSLRLGDCAFMRRDHRMWLQKLIENKTPYRSIVLKFSRQFLREAYQMFDKKEFPDVQRNKKSLYVFPHERPDVRSLFESVIPYFEAGVQPSDEILKLKMMEGLYLLLHTDKSLYASLFDLVDPWKLDILDFLNKNYMCDLTLEEIAKYTGRSLATVKRDFKKLSDLTPEKWLIRKRLEVAYELMKQGGRRIVDVYAEVGFKNPSHFSTAFKKQYGVPPTAVSA